jgi:hypothetical protein
MYQVAFRATATLFLLHKQKKVTRLKAKNNAAKENYIWCITLLPPPILTFPLKRGGNPNADLGDMLSS